MFAQWIDSKTKQKVKKLGEKEEEDEEENRKAKEESISLYWAGS